MFRFILTKKVKDPIIADRIQFCSEAITENRQFEAGKSLVSQNPMIGFSSKRPMGDRAMLRAM